MDRITASLLKEFAAMHGLQLLPESDAFEHFANYAVLYDELPDTFDLDEVAVGEDGNIGIDGLAIIVNGIHVTSQQDAESIVRTGGYLDVTFVFVQAKTTPSFDLGEIGKFLFAVGDFFADTPKLTHTEPTENLRQVKEYLYSQSGLMTNRNPNLVLYYVTTGKWTDDTTLQARIDSGKEELARTQLFNQVTFTPVDAAALQRLYRITKGKASASFEFLSKVALPKKIPGVSEAYFGVVPATEFLRLIRDDNGNIRKALFYDNVRDFQDYNEVNKDIRSTLQSSDRTLFALLNNGVTIIASTVRAVGNTLNIEDYQIVNGCQTSHVIFHEQAALSDEVYVPLKVIATDDDAIVAKVVKATNFQTEVKPEELYGLSEFQKRLEDYYATFEGTQRLFYERRSKQYAANVGVEKVRVVTKQQQMRAFVAMFMEEPHKGHYPRSLGPQVGKAIFARDHHFEPYYLSAFAQFRLEYFFRSKSIDARYKPARYHLLWGARHVLVPTPVPDLKANAIQRFCAELQRGVLDDAQLLAAFRRAAAIVDRAAGSARLIARLRRRSRLRRTSKRLSLRKSR